jgi:hypothetical protein
MRYLWLCLLFCALSAHATAQKSDTLTAEKKHSVKLATILSVGLPGAGQVYNHMGMPKGKKKAYWKVPLIYGCLGATTYFLINNQRNVVRYRTEYLNRTELGVYNPEFAQYDNGAILTIHNGYQTNRDLMILATFGVYVINILDAAVEAHFVSFDISDDLTLRLQPAVMMGFFPGFSMRFNFRERTNFRPSTPKMW